MICLKNWLWPTSTKCSKICESRTTRQFLSSLTMAFLGIQLITSHLYLFDPRGILPSVTTSTELCQLGLTVIYLSDTSGAISHWSGSKINRGNMGGNAGSSNAFPPSAELSCIKHNIKYDEARRFAKSAWVSGNIQAVWNCRYNEYFLEPGIQSRLLTCQYFCRRPIW